MLEILEEQKNEMQLTLNVPHATSFTRRKSLLATKKSVGHTEDVTALEDASKLDSSELQ